MKNLKILVIGDLILDRYMWGNINRISPEAPVPVVAIKKQSFTLGGAANVANNLSTLNAKVLLAGYIGEGINGQRLLQIIKEKNIESHLLLRSKTVKTIEKTRIIASNQQVVRFDIEEIKELSKNEETKLFNQIKKNIHDFSVIILSDYGKGTISNNFASAVIKLATKHKIHVLCDPKGYDYTKYNNATLITPNRKEAQEASGIKIVDDKTLQAAGKKIMKIANLKNLLITLGADGMFFFEKNKTYHIKSEAKEVFDVSGAGDTVIASIAFALSCGQSLIEACSFANIAAGIVVGKMGTATTNLSEIEEYNKKDEKVLSLKEILQKTNKHKDKKIVFTNGCFDILHAGHVQYLKEAASFGDILIVALNSDKSVKKLKGNGRPVNNQRDRAQVLSCLYFIDYIVVFDEETPIKVIKAICPDVLVKGKDYKKNEIVGANFVEKKGGKVKRVDLVKNKSTTNIINKIKGF